MRRPIPFKALIQEAERALAGLSKSQWWGRDEFRERFTYWCGGDSITVKVANIPCPFDPTGNSTTYFNFLEINPRRGLAVFSKGYTGYPAEERGIIEENLRKRGYEIKEEDYRWFHADKAEKNRMLRKARAA